jgi:hypothetical protein
LIVSLDTDLNRIEHDGARIPCGAGGRVQA